MTTFIAILIALMITGAIVAIASPNLLHSVISLGAVGFLLSIVFVFLGAPDLAITQLAVEVITLVLLLRTVRYGEPHDKPLAPHRISQVVAALLLILIAIISVGMFAEFPAFGHPVMERLSEAPSNAYLETGLESTGSANIVSSIILDFRAYDTLGEATVLFCAVLGALAILRNKDKNRRNALKESGT